MVKRSLFFACVGVIDEVLVRTARQFAIPETVRDPDPRRRARDVNRRCFILFSQTFGALVIRSRALCVRMARQGNTNQEQNCGCFHEFLT